MLIHLIVPSVLLSVMDVSCHSNLRTDKHLEGTRGWFYMVSPVSTGTSWRQCPLYHCVTMETVSTVSLRHHGDSTHCIIASALCFQAYEATFICGIEHKHKLARRHFSQLTAMAGLLDPLSAAAMGNQPVSKPISTVTDEHATSSTH